jgi:hypothetical protein
MAEATQTAVFFDEYDVMQIRTRKSMYHADADVDWNLDAIHNGQKLPDVVDTSIEESLAANKVNIKYKPAHYSDFNNGMPKMETVWQPEEDTVTLRATSLVKDLSSTGTVMWIPQTDASYWPYESDVNIEGEILHYKGKEYCYNTTTGKVYDIVTSLDDQTRFDSASDPDLKWANAYTGKLMITERSIGGTGAVAHNIKPAQAYSYFVTKTSNSVFYQTNNNHVIWNAGYLTLVSPVDDRDTLMVASNPAVMQTMETTYGMKFRFPATARSADGWAYGGLRISGSNQDSGIYITISPTDVIERIENRSKRHEISVYTMKDNTKATRLTFGYQAAIASGVWYALDVRYGFGVGNQPVVSIFLDGVFLGSLMIPTANLPEDNGRFGAYVQGLCNMDIEYIYAVHQDDAHLPDSTSFLDLETGGYTSGYIQRDWRFGGNYVTTSRGPLSQGGHWLIQPTYRANYVLNEFGPVVHEMRRFEVAFDDQKVPVIHSYPYVSNDSMIYCTDYWSDPFGAQFTLVNAARQTAIVNGEDDITFGPDNAITQKLLVYGRALYQDDDQTVTKSDDVSIRRNGLVSLDFESGYIQTKQNADDLAQWVVDEWGGSSDELNVNIFGNPLIQLGDLVTINYPTKGMFPSTHHYYVVGITNSWENGLSSGLILRRARV